MWVRLNMMGCHSVIWSCYLAKVEGFCSILELEITKMELILGGPGLIRWALKRGTRSFLRLETHSPAGLEEAKPCCELPVERGSLWELRTSMLQPQGPEFYQQPHWTWKRVSSLRKEHNQADSVFSLDHNLVRPWAEDPAKMWDSWPTKVWEKCVLLEVTKSVILLHSNRKLIYILCLLKALLNSVLKRGVSVCVCVCVCVCERKRERNDSKHGPRDFPGGTVVKNPPANAGNTGSGPGPGRSHMPWPMRHN